MKTILLKRLYRLVEIYYKIGLEKEASDAAKLLGYNYNSSQWYEKSYAILNKDYKIEKKSTKDTEKSKEAGWLKSHKKYFRQMKKNRAKFEDYSKKVSLLKKYNKEYFDKDAPSITDSKYDSFKKEIIELEKNIIFKDISVYSNLISSEPSNKFKKIKHSKPMLSLSNAFNLEDMKDFIKKVKNF